MAANDGNISVRLDNDRLLTTPTGISKGMIKEDDLVLVDMQGNKLAGAKQQTSELAMHLTIYGIRPDVNAVLHAHPPVATGFAAAGRPLNLALLPEIVIGLGSVPLADYGLPGTDELTRPMLPYIPQYDAVLDGQPRRYLLGRRRLQGFLPHGNGGALRAHHPGGGTARRTTRPAAGRGG